MELIKSNTQTMKWIKVNNYKRPNLKHLDVVLAKLFDGTKAMVEFHCCSFEYWWYYTDGRKGEPQVEFYKEIK